jgi:hypothetical protein
MCSRWAKGGAPTRQGCGQGGEMNGSARRLALPVPSGLSLLGALAGSLLVGPLLAGCGEGESATWVGVQDCAVGIPPETGSLAAGQVGAGLTSAQLPLAEAQVTALGSGFYIRNFTLGPIGTSPEQFSCEAPQVTARFVASVASLSAPGQATTGPGRPLELEPFDCLGNDGRSYRLDGEGQGDQDALFFSQTFTAWLGTERATLLCSTRFQRQVGGAAEAPGAAGAGGAPLPFGPASAPPSE